MKAKEILALLQILKGMSDESLSALSEARYWMEPRDYTDRFIAMLALGEQEWRVECRRS